MLLFLVRLGFIKFLKATQYSVGPPGLKSNTEFIIAIFLKLEIRRGSFVGLIKGTQNQIEHMLWLWTN